MARSCESCSLCCDLMRVEMEPPKPARCRCPHQAARGCSIYADRPKPCAGFACVWLVSQDLPGAGLMAKQMRPDRSGVVVELNSVGNLIAHCRRPGDWAREPMRSWLIGMTARAHVMIDDGRQTSLLGPDGKIEPLEKVGVDAGTNCRIYRRAKHSVF